MAKTIPRMNISIKQKIIENTNRKFWVLIAISIGIIVIGTTANHY